MDNIFLKKENRLTNGKRMIDFLTSNKEYRVRP